MVEIPKRPTACSEAALCLIRHGETEWNAARRIQGQIDIGLNDAGKRQAAAAGRWLRNAGIAALYASDLQRAWLTAAIIGDELGIAPQAAPELRERRYGIFEGLTYAEAEARHPEGYARFKCRDPDYDFATGESLKTLHARVTGKLLAIADAHAGQKVVVVVHGGVLDIVNRFVRGHPLETPRDFLIPNAGLNWIAAVDGNFCVKSWAETVHLAPGALDELPS